MAALALTLGGAALGSALLPSGVSILGATLSGAALGGAVGGLVGGSIDATLLAPLSQSEGPRLTDIQVQTSTEGAAVLRVFGRMRVGPTLIWATKLREERKTSTSGGKGGGPRIETTEYRYYATFALALCEGPIAGIGTVWADGRRMDLTALDVRLHKGGESQEPDPTIEAVEGVGEAPAYRGLAYLVFDDLPLEPYGNRIPQITVEVIGGHQPGSLEDRLTAVTLIPGAGEFAYETVKLRKKIGLGQFIAENQNSRPDRPDALVALDQLADDAPNIAHVALVVAWHGDDLRAGACQVRPKVETAGKDTEPKLWRVSGLERADAAVVSQVDGAPALGGTPSDGSVLRMIGELKARGYAVTLYPFLMMDVPAGNGLPNPYGGTGQPAYPWRGRITCHPAPGQSGTVDKTAAAAGQIAAFFGSAAPGDFGWDAGAETVGYSGPAEWSFRRLVLHYAALAAAAGGVDAFIIGSEMIGLTTVRSDAETYPAVAALKSLAGAVRQILGPATRIGYAADWTEYGPHRPDDGSGDLLFRMDALFADPDIDFVGIDAYFPLADWRDREDHLDAEAGARSQYDPDYLAANIEGGELFDWFYASSAARKNQNRSPITDGAYGEPWVHRIKDLRSWWGKAHHDRPGGARKASPTGWVPESKPIWLTEFGCPAVDKGANQPNVFVDPKSSESFVPYFSDGNRDDYAQRSYLEAVLRYWQDPDNNPPAAGYAGRMIDPDRLYAWTWDARPYPDFPRRTGLWADAGNWRLGHWLTGRLGAAALADVVRAIAEPAGVPIDVSGLAGTVHGYTLDRIMSPRQALEPLMAAFAFDAAESAGKVVFRHRGGHPAEVFGPDDLVAAREGSDLRLTRAQESELPASVKLRFVDVDHAYRQGAVESRRMRGATARIAETALAVALEQAEARAVADRLLMEAHVGRERAELTLPPRALALDAGDVVAIDIDGRITPMRIEAVGWELGRPARLTRTDPEGRRRSQGAPVETELPPVTVFVPPVVEIMDLPQLGAGDATPHAPWIAAYSKPFTPVAVYRSPAGTGFALDVVASTPAVIGALAFDLHAGPVWRWDRVNALYVDVPPGTVLESRDDVSVLSGANVAAIKTPSGEWEILQWRDATLVAPDRYRLSMLLRGQFGTEPAMGSPTPAGSRFVRLDGSLVRSSLGAAERGLSRVWRYGPAALAFDDELFVQETRAVAGLGLRPLAPVRLRARRAGADIQFSWIRRTRIDGDSWEGIEVPLGEAAEAYRLEILDGASIVRTAEVSAPAFTYTAAMQTADFGAPVASVTARVAQLSQAFGRGVWTA